MKTDLLQRINNSKDYLEELVYQLNGDYPDVKFKLEQPFDDWFIYTDSQDFIDSLINSDDSDNIIDNFHKKFKYCLLCFSYKEL